MTILERQDQSPLQGSIKNSYMQEKKKLFGSI